MKNAAQHARKLNGLIRRIKPKYDVPEYDELDPVEQLIRSFLLWEASVAQADAGYDRLMKGVVDNNDLRVTDADDIAAMLGPRFPRVEERAYRLKESLNDIYEREHAVSLDALKTMSKRDARVYLDALRGMVPFVSARVMLLSLTGHAIPLDDRMLLRLQADEVAELKAALPEVQAFLEHQVKASDAVMVAELLRQYAETTPVKVVPGPKKVTKKKTTAAAKKSSTARKTAKKKTVRKTARKSTKKTTKKTTKKKKVARRS